MKTADSGPTPSDSKRCAVCDTELRIALLGGQCPACMARTLEKSYAPPNGTSAQPSPEPDVGQPSDTRDASIRYFGDYELQGEVGRGGMGVVYKARQQSLQRIVALKLIAPEHLASPKAVERFHAEAEAAANLDHPNIVPVFESGAHEGRHYFSMKLIEGQSLAQRLEEFRLPTARSKTGLVSGSGAHVGDRPRHIARFLAKVADAIHYAHQRGILHRDLKPGNILIDAAGEPQVTDFGLAKRLESDSSLTLSGEAVGTPAYMAPEQAAGKTRQMTIGADIYSLGAVLYELLTGHPPFRRETSIETLHALLHEEPAAPRALNRAVPRDLETICLKCLEKEPARRYTNAHALAEDLWRFVNGEPVQARPIGAAGRVGRWCRRKPALAASLALLQLVLVAGLAGILLEWRQAKNNELMARQSLYAADISLAQQALAADNLKQALDLLQKHRPKPGESDLRGFEWRYLWQQCRSDELFSLVGHQKSVDSVAFSPDGKMLATGSSGYSTVAIWDLAARRAIATLTNHADSVHSVTFSPSGDLLAMASLKELWLWNTKTFQPLRSLPEATLKARFSPNGKYLVAEMTNGVVLRDTETWGAVRKLGIAGLQLLPYDDWCVATGLAVSPDSRRIAVACDEGIKLLRIPDLQETAMLRDSLPRARPIAFSPDGRTIAASARGHTMKVWDVETGQQTKLFSGHSDSVFGVAFSPDGRKLATASGDQTVKLWETATGQLIRTFRGHADEVDDVAFSPEGKLLATVSKDGAVKVWDALGSSNQAGDFAGVQPFGFDCEGNFVGQWTNGTFRAFDTESSQPLSNWAFTNALSYHPFGAVLADGRTAAFARRWASDPSEALGIELWDLNRGQLLFSHPDAVWRFAFSGEAGLLATGAGDQSVSLWRIPGGTRECVVTNAGLIVDLSRHGTMLATLVKVREGEINLWSVEGQRAERGPTLAASYLTDAKFSPDGRLLAAGMNDGLIRLWALPSRQPIATLTGHKRGKIYLSFSSDGRTLASTSDDETIRLWHVATGRELLKFQLPMGEVTSKGVAFSPDGRTLGAYRRDEHGALTRLWFAPSLAEIAVAEGIDYRANMGGDPAIWLVTGKALARRDRDIEALEVFAKMIEFCGSRPDLKPFRTSALKQRAQLLKHLGRVAEAGADNLASLDLPPHDPRAPAQLLDLSLYFNGTLDWNSLDHYIPPAPFLADLPRGLKALPGSGGVRWDLRGVVQLNKDPEIPGFPRAVADIQVRQRCHCLHFLHAVHKSEKPGTRIGTYLLHYADGQQEEVPVVYGRDLLNWKPTFAEAAAFEDGKVAWIAKSNHLSYGPGTSEPRVYMTTWANPRADVEIVSLDYVSSLTECAPFLLAVTAEP
jgi:eukaryotic-like serine/threonine-protein kinase